MRLLPKWILGFVLVLGLVACGSGKTERVLLQTEMGDILIEVYKDKAPVSAADFLYYVDEGLYDGQGFYRAVRPETDPRQMGMQLIQGGRLDLEMITAPIDHESTKMTGLSHVDGAVSIAREEPGTGSAAFFFISIGENKFLDYGGSRNPDGQGYAVFGRVVKGMDVVRAIQMQETGRPTNDPATQGQFLTKPVIITKARRY